MTQQPSQTPALDPFVKAADTAKHNERDSLHSSPFSFLDSKSSLAVESQPCLVQARPRLDRLDARIVKSRVLELTRG
jgi:hypothetical protein